MGRITPHIRRAACLALVALLATPAGAGLRFRNVLLGAGVNTAIRDIRLPASVRAVLEPLPDLRDYAETSRRTALLVDIRFQFDLSAGWRWVPAVQFWNWGDFPGPRRIETDVEHSIRDLAVSLAVHRTFTRQGRWAPYVGAGPGFQFLALDSKFPPDMFAGAPIVVQRLSVTEAALNVSALIGVDVKLRESVSLFHEVRWEKAGQLSQFQFLVGITTL